MSSAARDPYKAADPELPSYPEPNGTAPASSDNPAAEGVQRLDSTPPPEHSATSGKDIPVPPHEPSIADEPSPERVHPSDSTPPTESSYDSLPGPNEIAVRIGDLKKREQYGYRIALEAMLQAAYLLWIMYEKHGYRGKRYERFAEARGIHRSDAYLLLNLGPGHSDLLAQFDIEARTNPNFAWPHWRQVARRLRPKPPADSEDNGEDNEDAEPDPAEELRRANKNLEAQVKAATQQMRNERVAKEEVLEENASLRTQVQALERERDDLRSTVQRLNQEIDRLRSEQPPEDHEVTSGVDPLIAAPAVAVAAKVQATDPEPLDVNASEAVADDAGTDLGTAGPGGSPPVSVAADEVVSAPVVAPSSAPYLLADSGRSSEEVRRLEREYSAERWPGRLGPARQIRADLLYYLVTNGIRNLSLPPPDRNVWLRYSGMTAETVIATLRSASDVSDPDQSQNGVTARDEAHPLDADLAASDHASPQDKLRLRARQLEATMTLVDITDDEAARMEPEMLAWEQATRKLQELSTLLAPGKALLRGRVQRMRFGQMAAAIQAEAGMSGDLKAAFAVRSADWWCGRAGETVPIIVRAAATQVAKEAPTESAIIPAADENDSEPSDDEL